MESTLDSLVLGFSVAFRPDVLLYAFLGCLVGTLVGMLPGIGPLAGISILLPVTFGLDATKAIVMLAGIYYGSQYGGSTTSILMRIPGEAASVMTCIDGYAMAQKGRAGAALAIAAVGSFVAGTFGVIMLTLVAPPLANFALRFGPPEYTALLVLGLVFLAYMSSTSLVRTLLMASLGLLLGCIGIDVMTGHFRYSFDIKELGDGIGIVPVAVGLFGLGEILSTPSKTVTREGGLAAPARAAAQSRRNGASRPCRSRAARCWASSSASCRARRTLSRASCPMRWRSASRKHARGVRQRRGGRRRRAGIGQQLGLDRRLRADAGAGAADRAGDRRADGGAADPRRTAGTQLVSEHPDVFWGFIASMYVGNIMLLALNLPLVGLFVSVLRIPYAYLYPLIIMFCIIGVYEVNHSIVDVWIMLIMGVFGYMLRKFDFDPAPLVLGLVIAPTFELSLRQSLVMSSGNWLIFLKRPIVGDAAGRVRGPAGRLGHLRARPQGLARQARRGRGGRGGVRARAQLPSDELQRFSSLSAEATPFLGNSISSILLRRHPLRDSYHPRSLLGCPQKSRSAFLLRRDALLKRLRPDLCGRLRG